MAEGQISVSGKVSATLIIGLLVHLVAVVWWGATLNANQNNMNGQLIELKSKVDTIGNRSDPNPVQDQRIQQNAQGLTDVKAEMAELKNRVGQLERKP